MLCGCEIDSRAYCISSYDAAWWKLIVSTEQNNVKTILAKLRSYYHKCWKIFLGYNHRYIVN
jgi:hypothetical protein